MLRHDYKPVIFLINNRGYTIERLLAGQDRALQRRRELGELTRPRTCGREGP
jgi:hypothetical protein